MKKGLGAIFFVIAATGCTTSLHARRPGSVPGEAIAAKTKQFSVEQLVIPFDQDFVPRNDLSKAEIAEDIDFLKALFGSIYSARHLLGESVIQNTLSQFEGLKGANISSTKELKDLLCKIFDRMNDRHLDARIYGNDKNWIHCHDISTEAKIGKNWGGDEDSPPKLDRINVGKKVVIVLAIPSLDGGQAWDGLYSKFSDSLKTSDALIVDLRGNGGGADELVLPIIQTILGVKKLNTTSGGRPLEAGRGWFAKKHPLTMALSLNKSLIGIRYDLDHGRELSANTVEDWKKKRAELEGRMIPIEPLPVQFESGDQPQIDFSHLWDKPIVVLQDRSCWSSCEYVTEHFSILPNTVTIGQNTGGAFHFVWPTYIFLKNSRVRLNIPRSVISYPTDRIVEKVGLPPGIFVQDGVDAWTYALNFLKEKLGN